MLIWVSSPAKILRNLTERDQKQPESLRNLTGIEMSVGFYPPNHFRPYPIKWGSQNPFYSKAVLRTALNILSLLKNDPESKGIINLSARDGNNNARNHRKPEAETAPRGGLLRDILARTFLKKA